MIMAQKSYVGDLVAGSLLKKEGRILAQILLNGVEKAEWKRLVESENILQMDSINAAKRIASTVKKRIEPLGPSFWKLVVDATDDELGQLMFIAVVLHSQLVQDFYRAEISQPHQRFVYELERNAWLQFCEDRGQHLEEIAIKAESTLKKMGQNVHKMLVDVGVISDLKDRRIQPIVLLDAPRQYLLAIERADLIGLLEMRD